MGLFALLMLIPFGPRLMESEWGYKMSKWIARVPLLGMSSFNDVDVVTFIVFVLSYGSPGSDAYGFDVSH